MLGLAKWGSLLLRSAVAGFKPHAAYLFMTLPSAL